MTSHPEKNELENQVNEFSQNEIGHTTARFSIQDERETGEPRTEDNDSEGDMIINVNNTEVDKANLRKTEGAIHQKQK